MKPDEAKSRGTSVVGTLKGVAFRLACEAEEYRYLSLAHRDPRQAEDAMSVAWKSLREAQDVCDAIKLVRRSA